MVVSRAFPALPMRLRTSIGLPQASVTGGLGLWLGMRGRTGRHWMTEMMAALSADSEFRGKHLWESGTGTVPGEIK